MEMAAPHFDDRPARKNRVFRSIEIPVSARQQLGGWKRIRQPELSTENGQPALKRRKMNNDPATLCMKACAEGAFGNFCGRPTMKTAAGEASAHLENISSGKINLLNVVVLEEIGTYGSFHYFGFL